MLTMDAAPPVGAALKTDAAKTDATAAAGSRRPVRAGGRRRLAGWVLVAAGLALVPWLLMLAAGAAGGTEVVRWSVAWLGLDALEAAGLVATGVLLVRGHALRCLAATATATLLVADAWFDTTTSGSAAERLAALAMAFGAELPLAAACALVAVRALAEREA